MPTCDYPQLVVKAGTPRSDGKGNWETDIYNKCGKCYNCRMSRLRTWIWRCKQEVRRSLSAYFITLTYDNDNIPLTKNKFPTLVEDHMSKFIRKLRKTQSKDIKIRYYGVGEYGTHGDRPHYHMIIYNVIDQREIIKCWGKGQVHIGQVTAQSVAYTLAYINCQTKPKHKNDDRVMEVIRHSRDIGTNWITDSIKNHFQQNWQDWSITDRDGTKIAMPRSFRDKIFDKETKLDQADIAQRKVSEIEVELYQKHTFEEIERMRLARVTKLNNQVNKKSKI